MRSMTRWTVAGCMALAALSAVAVFDVGSSRAEAAPSVSPFAGSWSGTWMTLEDVHDGTFDWTISDAGRLTGRIRNNQSGDEGAVVGHVHADGSVNMNAFAPADDPTTGCGVGVKGTLVFDGDDKLDFSFTRTNSGAALFATLERN